MLYEETVNFSSEILTPSHPLSSPIFCCLELIGFMLTYANVILMIGVPTTVTCYLSPIVFNLGFVLVLG